MPPKPKWNRHTILAELHSRHMTYEGLVELYNLPKYSFSNIWSRSNKAAEKAIADFLGEPVEQLFSDRYPKTRNRILRPSYPANTQNNKPSVKAA